MLRHFILHPGLYLHRPCCGARLFFELDVRAGFFLCIEGILETNNARVCDGRVGEEDGLEFGRGDLKAGDFDEFLFTVGWYG